MRVGVVTASVSRNAGGVFDGLRQLSMAMHRPPDLELRVFGLEDASTMSDLENWGCVPVEVCAVRGPKFFGYSPDLCGAINAASLDLLHLHGLWMFTSIAVRTCGKSGRIPYLVSPHGMLDHWALRNSGWKKRIAAVLYESRCLCGASCLHALCEAELAAIRKLGLRNPVCVIPNGIRVPSGSPSRSVSWRAGLPDDAKMLLYLGRIHPKKGLRNLLTAWADLSSSGSNGLGNWFLVIAGWEQNGYRKELEAGLPAKVADRVRFVGPQFNLNKEATLASSDAFILPSLSEGLPLAVLEAWAHALPVLMSPQCNLPEGFREGAAMAIDPEPASISRCLRRLFRMSDEDRRAMGRRGRALLTERFNVDMAAAQHEAVYRWMSGAGPRPDCVQLS